MGQPPQKRISAESYEISNDGTKRRNVSKREIWNSFNADTQEFLKSWPSIDWVENVTQGLICKDFQEGVICQYCGNPAELIDSKEIYGKSYGMAWLCNPCDAYVGTHKNSKDHKPLGKLANKQARESRKQAHAVFDPLWQRKMERDGCSKSEARKAGYAWLAKQMGIDVKHCHISWFFEKECQQVVDICRNINRNSRS